MFAKVVLVVCVIIGWTSAQNVPWPAGFTMLNYNGQSGSFASHPGYLTYYYGPGIYTRYVVTVPSGQLAQVSIDPRSTQTFSLRSYDYAVMMDGTKVSQLTSPCSTTSYAALGTQGVDYNPILMADTSKIRTLIGRSNVVVVDLCVDPFNSGYDTSMLGFRAYWSSVASSATTTTTPPPTPQCGQPVVSPAANPNKRIVNGVNAMIGAQPWMCALVKSYGSSSSQLYQYCGCTLIASQWVVTAAHCVPSVSDLTSYSKVVLGLSNLTQLATSGTTMSIVSAFVHPSFNQGGIDNNDVALIKLSAPVVFSSVIQPACLPSQPVSASATLVSPTTGREIAYVAGWGLLSESQTSMGAVGSGTDLLQQTAVEIYSNSDCLATNDGAYITSNMFCAGYQTAGVSDSCKGDSGGPLITQQLDKTWTLDGIVSWGQGCSEQNSPGVYTNVFNMKPWMLQTMASN